MDDQLLQARSECGHGVPDAAAGLGLVALNPEAQAAGDREPGQDRAMGRQWPGGIRAAARSRGRHPGMIWVSRPGSCCRRASLMIMQWIVRSERSLYADQWLEVRSADVELPDGRHLDHGCCACPRPPAPSPWTTAAVRC
jgi:hypothetical protein